MLTEIFLKLKNLDKPQRDATFIQLRAIWPGFYHSVNLSVIDGELRAFTGKGDLNDVENLALQATLLSAFPDAIIVVARPAAGWYPPADLFAGAPTAPSDPQWSLWRLLLIAVDSYGCDTRVRWYLNRGRIELEVESEYKLSLPMTAEMLEAAACAEHAATQPGSLAYEFEEDFVKRYPDRAVAHLVLRNLSKQQDRLLASPAERWNATVQTKWYNFLDRSGMGWPIQRKPLG